MKETLLELKDVALIYQTKTDEIHAVKNLSFRLNEGEFISVIGPSGCGKTTILSLIAGLMRPTHGTISVNKENARFGYMLQKDQLFPWRTIEKNIFLPLEIMKKLDKAHISYAEDLLKKYGLYEFRKNYPAELSGGMRQRAALIRTLSFNPDILLLDEPFSALDYQTRLSVCDDVYRIIKDEGKSTILVTHDISEAISMSDKIIVLSQRPCCVKNVHDIPHGDETPLKRRERQDFSKWFEILWKELNE
ncbi:MAG: taurine ABC transporter ATP-binding protein [Bacillota bacterium]|nr:MAG: taurine ABC transporter ATP-binding protein [Bacillota bacterium]